MKLAYIDTSCLVAVAFGEPGYTELLSRLSRFDLLISSNLLEAELRAAMAREGVGGSGATLLSWITWTHPNRPLTQEIDRILKVGALKGADLWHLACALFLSPDPEELSFLSFDRRQREVARNLGFPGIEES